MAKISNNPHVPPSEPASAIDKNLGDSEGGGDAGRERAVLWLGAVWFFFILFSYYVLRPIREQISSTYGTENLSWLFAATFVVMLIAIPTYSLLVGKFHRSRLVPSIYVFFIVNLILFWAGMKHCPASQQIWGALAFFVWISVFGLFIVSFFWSVIGDMLSTGQGRRIFGYIAGRWYPRWACGLPSRRAVGRRNWRCEPAFDSSGAAVCCYGLFMATCGTTVYFQQSEIVKSAYEHLEEEPAKEARTEYFANINFSVSLVTALPLAYAVGIGCLALCPSIEVLAVVTVIGRAVEYGIANPAREVLFTSVNREDRYKAKSFIDTIVRRGGDSAVGSIYRALRETAGLAMTTLSWIVIPIALAWAVLGLYIGKENKRAVEEQG